MLEDNHITIMRVLRADASPHAAERLGRTYTLVFGRDPIFPDVYRAIVYRGGDEQRPTIHAEFFDDEMTMLKDAKGKIRDRFNHGYSLIWNSPDFPLLAWIVKRGYSVEYDDSYKPPGIQLHLPLMTEFR